MYICVYTEDAERELPNIHICTCIYTYIHIYTSIYINIHIYTYIHVYTCMYTYIHIYTHIYTYIHQYTFRDTSWPEDDGNIHVLYLYDTHTNNMIHIICM